VDTARRRALVRLLDAPEEYARVRRLHPNVDEAVLRALQGDFERQLSSNGADPQAMLTKLDETLSNLLQFSPQRAVLAEDPEGELDRLYREHVEPPRLRAAAVDAGSRTGIRLRMRATFRSAGLLPKLAAGVRVEEFTHPGDPFHLDFGYWKNGTRGFLHALPLGRDPGHAKVLAFTAERIRARLTAAEFTAVTEAAPQPGDERHQFVAGLLAEQNVALVPLARLEELASRLRATLQ
jgi:hypothetical protein